MTQAIYPGTFDPVTRGHLDIIERSARLFDNLIVAVGDNPAKKPLFTLAERVAMLKRETGKLQRVEVRTFRGLLVRFAKQAKSNVIIRGIRNVGDFEYELQMSLTNHAAGGTETVFMVPRPELAFVRSQLIREIAAGGGDVSSMVTPEVEAALHARLTGRRRV